MELKTVLNRIVNHPLNKNKKAAAVGRFVNWQLSSRLYKKQRVINYVNNSLMIVERGFSSSTAAYYMGLAEFEEMGFLLHFLREEDYFVDVGANIGSFSVLSSAVCGCITTAIEPIEASFHLLQKNIEINKVKNKVTPLNIGMADKAGRLNFTLTKGQNNKVAKQNDSNSISVITNTLDNVCKRVPALLKIDVEGFETKVLQGAESILHNPQLKAIIIEMMGLGEQYGFDESKIHQQLLDLGFRPYQYNPQKRTLTLQENSGDKNIYIRDINFVKERITSANPFRVFNVVI